MVETGDGLGAALAILRVTSAAFGVATLPLLFCGKDAEAVELGFHSPGLCVAVRLIILEHVPGDKN